MRMLRKESQDHGLLGKSLLINEKETIKIQAPEPVKYIAGRLRSAGYEAYIVGGCVRDCLLGRTPKDWDITTSALPVEVKSLFSNTADTGLSHGTVTVIVSKKGYEVTTYRIDGEYKDGRHPEKVTFTPSLEEDLKRRDFTINAFAYSEERGVIDLFNGLEDLKNRKIRAVGDPGKRFSEDALRIMRAVRFSAQLSFDIEESTRAAIGGFAENLARISRERKRVEFEKTLFSDNPQLVDLYAELGLSGYIIPDAADEGTHPEESGKKYLRTFEKCFDPESERLYKYNKDGLMRGLSEDAQRASRAFMLAAFFKNLSCAECRSVMRQMTFDNKTRDLTALSLEYMRTDIPNERAAIKKIMKKSGHDALLIALNLQNAQKVSNARDNIALLEDILNSGEPYKIPMLAVSGSDLIEAGAYPGAALGAELERLLDIVIQAPELNKKDVLLKLADK